MRLATIMALGVLLVLPGCWSLGVSGSAQPANNTQVVMGAEVNQNGTVKPNGKVIFDLF